jgi:hypothetical protein
MQINETTYETIFLLYIDNELSQQEKLKVEDFIAAHPSYALEMEALKATVLRPENLQYAFKEDLKQQKDEKIFETLEEDWDPMYSSILKAAIQAIPGLPTKFKNDLKKTNTTKGIVIKPFGFNQNKFTYAAIAACLLVFLGYQQLTKIQVNSNAAEPLVETSINSASSKTFAKNIEPNVNTKHHAIAKLQTSNASKIQNDYIIQKESFVIAEPSINITSLKQNMISELTSNYNNPININAVPVAISSTNIDIEPTEEEKEVTSYEILDTEDAERTIFIANFEIDGAAFRGITRRVTALLKRNKSEKEK